MIAVCMKLRVVTKVLLTDFFMYGLDQLCLICGTLSTFAVGKMTVYVNDFYHLSNFLF